MAQRVDTHFYVHPRAGIDNIVNAISTMAAGPSSYHRTGGSPLKHDPFISFTGTSMTVGVRGNDGSTTTLHPQSAPDHFISHIWVTDENGDVVVTANITDNATPSNSFTVPAGVKKLTPWEYCNLHGLWKGPTYVVAFQQASTPPPPPRPLPIVTNLHLASTEMQNAPVIYTCMCRSLMISSTLPALLAWCIKATRRPCMNPRLSSVRTRRPIRRST